MWVGVESLLKINESWIKDNSIVRLPKYALRIDLKTQRNTDTISLSHLLSRQQEMRRKKQIFMRNRIVPKMERWDTSRYAPTKLEISPPADKWTNTIQMVLHFYFWPQRDP